MDHRYIDDHSVAQRYLDHTLPPDQRSRFEAHLVDCQECTDRVLLAGMFLNQNGRVAPPTPSRPAQSEPPATGSPTRLRFVISMTPGQLFRIRLGVGFLTAATLLLVAWLLLRARS